MYVYIILERINILYINKQKINEYCGFNYFTFTNNKLLA